MAKICHVFDFAFLTDVTEFEDIGALSPVTHTVAQWVRSTNSLKPSVTQNIDKTRNVYQLSIL